MSERNKQFQARIQREIPISRHMQVSVASIGGDFVTVACPLEPNINHKQTAFGGSVHSLALVACWSLATLTVQALEAEGLHSDYIVVQDSSIDYKLPVVTDFTASAAWESSEAKSAFLRTLRKRGRARAGFVAEVLCQGKVCAVAQARFVAQIIRA